MSALDNLFGLRRLLLNGAPILNAAGREVFSQTFNLLGGWTVAVGVDENGKPTIELTPPAGGGGGAGDVVGPGAAVADRIALFNGTTGKLIKDGGSTIAGVLASALAAAQSYANGVGSAVAAAIPSPGSGPSNVTKAAAANGSSSDYARIDHKHDATTAAPADQSLGAVGADGSASSLARSDHKHRFTGTPGRVLAVDASGFVSDTDTILASKTISYAANDAVGAGVTFRKRRGTEASPTAHNAGDVLGFLTAQGRDASADFDAASLLFVASQAGGTGKRTQFQSQLHNGNAKVTGEIAEQVYQLTTNSTATVIASIAVPADGIVSIAVRWAAKDQASSNRLLRETTAQYRRIGSGSIAALGASDALGGFSDVPAWATGLSPNDTTHTVDITGQGSGALHIDWTVDYVAATR